MNCYHQLRKGQNISLLYSIVIIAPVPKGMALALQKRDISLKQDYYVAGAYGIIQYKTQNLTSLVLNGMVLIYNE